MSLVDFMLLPFNAFFDFIFSNIVSEFLIMVIMFFTLYYCVVIPIWSFMGVKN